MLHDRDIREPLFDFLEEKYDKIRILEEKSMGQSRADVMMVLPDRLVGIEIKSDADSYARLERQVKDYDRYFDENIVVVGSTHAMHIKEHVPDYWGIISVEIIDDSFDFYVIREPETNPEINAELKLGFLWRPELAHIQQLNNLPAYKEKSKAFVRQKIYERVPADMLNSQISDELFERDYNAIAEALQEYRRKNHRPVRRKRKKKLYRSHI